MKYVYLKSAIIYMLFLVLGVIILGTILMPKIVESESHIYSLESLHKNSEVDFNIKYPSLDQVDYLKNMDSIDKITTYYRMFTKVYIDTKTIEYNIIMLNDLADIEYTPYNSNRLISGTTPNGNEEAIIDYNFANRHNLQVGDSFKIKFGLYDDEFDFTVSGISENNPIMEETIVIGFSVAVETAIKTVPVFADNFHFDGAYITSIDVPETRTYLLENYQPLALLRERSEFNSDLAYQDYLNDFNSEDYTVDIYQTETVYQSNQTTIKSYESTILNNQIFSIIFICAIFIVMGILSFLINQKALNKLFLKGENANNYLIANISFGIVSLIVLLIFNGILTNSAIRSLDVPLFNNLYSGKIFSIYIFGFISILLINIIIFILNRGNQTRLKRK